MKHDRAQAGRTFFEDRDFGIALPGEVLYHLFLLSTEVGKRMRVWRNWQTRTVQVRMRAIS